MLNLLKKDFKACFKADIKTMLKLVIGIAIFSYILFPISSITIPIFISYILIFRSFYLDELNKCDYLFNSLAIDKEDIVYSKYIFATFIIITSFIFIFFYAKVMASIWGINNITATSITITLNILLIIISICFPIMFKYGYSKSYIISNLIVAVILIITIFMSISPRSTSDVSEVLIYNNLIYFTGICMAIYILSMFISKKIYVKKEIAR